MPERLARRLLLVGWSAADWKLLSPLLDAGHLPTLERLVDGGVMGDASTIPPAGAAPALWTSIATGKRPDKHDVVGAVEPDPLTGRTRPIASTSRRTKALWSVLSQSGLRSHVVGWPATHPAEPIQGVVVSERFAAIPAQAETQPAWPMPLGAIHPARLEPALQRLRLHPNELLPEHLAPFIPRAAELPAERFGRVKALGRALARCATIHNAATWLMENEPWDLAMVCYDPLSRVAHILEGTHPLYPEPIPDADRPLYAHLLEGMARYLDMMLERLVHLAGPDAAVLLVSDHGALREGPRPADAPPGPRLRSKGLLCLRSPGIRSDERIYGASILDVAPTALALLGVEPGADMDGRPLVEAFVDPPALAPVASWDAVEGDAGLHPDASEEDVWEARDALRRLAEEGYAPAPADDAAERATRAAEAMRSYLLACAHLDRGDAALALPLLETVASEHPDEPRFPFRLAQCYARLGRKDDARPLLERLRAQEGPRPRTHIVLADLALLDGRLEEALAHLRSAEEAAPELPAIHDYVGRVFLRMKRFTDAERALRRAIALDPERAPAHDGLSVALLEQERWEEAAEAALDAVRLEHHLPAAHFHLGLALVRLDRLERAGQAFRTCLAMRPAHKAAREALARLGALEPAPAPEAG